MEWQSPFERDHPLVGRIWDVEAGAFVEAGALLGRARAARYVLLGEKHDNADHHRLQATLIEHLAAAGRRPALVVEMIAVDRQAAVSAAEAGGPDEVARAADWEGSWGGFELYRPPIAAALAAGLPLVAGNLPRDTVRALARGGADAIDPALVRRLGLDQPLDPAVSSAMAEELVAAHCGLIPAHAAAAMVPAQRARDAQLADRVLGAATPDGSVLLAGNGHVRTDRGVGALVRRAEPEARTLALAFVEVAPGFDAPDAYAEGFVADHLPFDAVWFTPRASDEDPCEAM